MPSKHPSQSQVEIDRLVYELKNATEQKVWAERQAQKLERELKQKVAAEKSAAEERRKVGDLEKKYKAEVNSVQAQLRKLTVTLRAKDARITELNQALQKSPKRKVPITSQAAAKPMMTKFFEEGSLILDPSAAQKAQKTAEAWILCSHQKENDELEKKMEDIYKMLAPGSVAVGNIASRVYDLVSKSCAQRQGAVSLEKYREQENAMRELEKRLKVAENQWKKSERHLELVLSSGRSPRAQLQMQPGHDAIIHL